MVKVAPQAINYYKVSGSSAKAPQHSWQAPSHIGIAGVSRERHTTESLLAGRKSSPVWGFGVQPHHPGPWSNNRGRAMARSNSVRSQFLVKSSSSRVDEQLKQGPGNEPLDQVLGDGHPWLALRHITGITGS